MKLANLCAALLLGAASIAHAQDHAPHWDYGHHHGPAQWSSMESDFAACKVGKEQSPIDIRHAVKGKLPALDLHYKSSAAEIVNNGHTIQVNLSDAGTLTIDGVPYRLVQFHFHTPSEEKINGHAYAMVAHLVHQSADGKVAVIAVLFKEGKANAALADVFAHLPRTQGSPQAMAAGFDPTTILPAEQGYYSYTGSLT
ncbi:MAG TPA: carbonic anhydrase family protein, partial [Variovorax sp.]